jgi:hypothetical protein
MGKMMPRPRSSETRSKKHCTTTLGDAAKGGLPFRDQRKANDMGVELDVRGMENAGDRTVVAAAGFQPLGDEHGRIRNTTLQQPRGTLVHGNGSPTTHGSDPWIPRITGYPSAGAPASRWC